MKIIFSLVFLMAGVQAHADSFTIIKDGKNYVCTSTETPEPPPNTGGAIACGNKAYAGPFSKEESIRLCSGALDVGPADCGIKAYAGPFNKEEIAYLIGGYTGIELKPEFLLHEFLYNKGKELKKEYWDFLSGVGK